MNFARLLRVATRPERSIGQLDDILQAWAARDAEQDRYNRARAHGVELGLYEWYSLNHPHEAIDEVRLLAEDEYEIQGMAPWVWLRQHKLECFHRKPRAARPLCGAQTRPGAPCKMRVHLREDGSLSARCKLHGGASTGPKSKKGRAAIAASNRRRAQARREAASP
jgi:hypothetical protein